MMNAWRKKWLGLMLAGILAITGMPGWGASVAAEAAQDVQAVVQTQESSALTQQVTEELLPDLQQPEEALPVNPGSTPGAGLEAAEQTDSEQIGIYADVARIRVADAIAKGNNGEAVWVAGTVVGHATGSLSANFTAPFGNDFNLLIADAAGERDKAKLVNVQVPSGLRAQFGLQSNPDLIGQQIYVSGTLAAYNNFPGLKSVTQITLSTTEPGNPGEGEEPGEDPDEEEPGETPSLPDGTGKSVLFDNAHAQTAGAADWIIDGAFSDFAQGLREAGFTVDSLERPVPYTFGEAPITYAGLQPYDVFIIPEANIPFKTSEQEALVQYVEDGGAVFFISDHYNADRNKNRWDASEVFNGYRRGAYENPAKGMSSAEAGSPAMQGVASSDWLADHFGVRFRFNAIGDVNANDIASPSQSFGITAGVDAVAMHAGSTLAILDPEKAKGLVYVPVGVPAWGNAVDEGVYNNGGRAEGPYAAIGKLGLGKAAFIGDSSPVEDATPKYVREENGQAKKTYDGFKEVDDALFLVQTVKWLAHDENYTSFSEVPGLELDTPTVLDADEAPALTTEPEPEPWAQPAPGYKWYDPATFKPGSYGSTKAPETEPVLAFVHQATLPTRQEFQIRLTANGLTPGQTVSGLRAGIYLPGGEQIARFKHDAGTWSGYNYSPEFSLTGNAQGYASRDLTVQLKPGVTAAKANLRLKQGSANVITNQVTLGNVAAEPLPGDHPPVPEVSTIFVAREAAEGTVVTVEGVITSQPGLFGGQGFYLQDETAGIYVFQSDTGYQAGDLIRISAVRTVYNGEVELENPVHVEKLGTAPLPLPQIQDTVNELNQGQLITLTNVVIQDVVTAAPAGSFEFNALSEGGQTIRVRFDGRTGVTLDEFNTLHPEGSQVDLTGVASVFRGTYQLKPLTLAHVVPSSSEADLIAPVADVAIMTGAERYNLDVVASDIIPGMRAAA
ncbi:DUF6359 domain-containing protein [Paenibacillus sanguinis]|uniref:DUF6359 domain-containing protein n=1 Tax=Paenibacillus sanguinis TaxID=225906 RepID=UPI00036369F7|nr:DUF6359 domain-containing protein [Paenibacillus sanguinis]